MIIKSGSTGKTYKPNFGSSPSFGKTTTTISPYGGLKVPSIGASSVATKSGYIPQPIADFIQRPNISGPIPSPMGGNIGVAPNESPDAWQQAAGFFGSVLGGVVKTVEMPFAAANEATKPMFGPGGVIGAAANALDKTPIGEAARIGEAALNESQKIVPASTNMNFASLLAATRDMPDNAPLDMGGGMWGLGSAGTINRAFAGVPLVGLLSSVLTGEGDVKTVGDLRALAAKRGFNEEDIVALATGAKNPWDFGEKKVSPNAILDLGYRFGMDPLNVAFLGGGAALGALKTARAGMKITGWGADLMPVLEKSGVYTGKALDAAASAEAIGAGDYAKATWQGLGTFLHDTTRAVAPKVVKGTVLTDAGIVGFDALTGTASDMIGKQSPIGGLLGQLHGLSSDIINDRPLSESSLFALVAASAFPLHEVGGMIKGGARSVKARRIQPGYEDAAFQTLVPVAIRKQGIEASRKWANENIAGGLDALIDHTDMSIAYKTIRKFGGPENYYRSIPEAALSTSPLMQATRERMLQMRADGLISNDMRIKEIKSWTENERAYTPTTVANKEGTRDNPALGRQASAMRMTFTPELALAQWNQGFPIMRQVADLLAPYRDAGLTLGLTSTFTKERIQAMGHMAETAAKQAADVEGAPKGMVSPRTMSRLLTQFPEIAQAVGETKSGAWWLQFLKPEKAQPVSMKSLRQRIKALENLAPGTAEVAIDAAIKESKAPVSMPINPSALDAIARQDAAWLGGEVAAQLAQTDLGQAAALRESLAPRIDAATSELASLTAKAKELDTLRQAERDHFDANGSVLPGHEKAAADANLAAQKWVDANPDFHQVAKSGQLTSPAQERIAALTTELRDMQNAAPGLPGGGLPAFTGDLTSLNWSPEFRATLDALMGNDAILPGGAEVPTIVKGLTLDDFYALAPIQKILDEYGTPYQLTFAPDNPLIWDKPGHVDTRLMQHSALAQSVMDNGFFSAVPRFLEFLTKPVENSAMREAATQAIYGELVGPYGLAPKDVAYFLGQLEAEANRVKLFNVPVFRGRTGLLPSVIDRIAKETFGSSGKKGYAKVIDSGDSFQRIIDRASNRFWRKADLAAQVKPGTPGAMERAFAAGGDLYEKWQASGAGRAGRMLKVYYPIFRFISDPRWWAMNYFEADMLATFRHGVGQAMESRHYRSWESLTEAERNLMAQRALPEYTHKYGNLSLDEVKQRLASELPDEGGELWARNQGGYIARDFNASRLESTQAVIDRMASTDPVFINLQRRFGGDSSTWAKKLDDMLYQFDQKGTRKTFADEADRMARTDPAYADPEFRKFLNHIADENQKVFDTVANIYAGNAKRSNIERVLNSYWLYWPLSYQLKAGKWMFDVLTKKGVFGKNLSGAYWWNHVAEGAQSALATDTDLQQLVKDNAGLFMFTQMLFPITPADMGVSLNRLDRYVGGYLGLWPPYNKASDPISLAASMIEMGPIYTFNLLKQTAAGLKKSNMLPTLPASIPESLGATLPQYEQQPTQ